MRYLKITPFLIGHPIIISYLIFKINQILSSDGFGVIVAPIFVGFTLFMIFTLIVDRVVSTRINIKPIVVTEVLFYIGLFILVMSGMPYFEIFDYTQF
jgi:ABC-type transport system involved in cytochrome c biogenesis permease subunit